MSREAWSSINMQRQASHQYKHIVEEKRVRLLQPRAILRTLEQGPIRLWICALTPLDLRRSRRNAYKPSQAWATTTPT